MDITLNRLVARQPYWSADSIVDADIIQLKESLIELPFEGDDEDRKYGFAHVGLRDGVIYGLFIQKYPKVVTDYNSQTKIEESQEIRDSGEYLFVFYPKRYELFLQAKRSSDLPSNTQIIKRFVGLWKRAAIGNKFLVQTFDYTQESFDRERILDIFYKESDTVTELELEDFDRGLVLEQKLLRGGKHQTYFNPIEEYQPAMEEAALRFGNNTQRASVKAKTGESFKKDAIVRAMLEGSRKPIKIVYQKDSVTRTEYGLVKKKEVISVDSGDFNIEDQIDKIIARLEGSSMIKERITNSNNSQVGLFDDAADS